MADTNDLSALRIEREPLDAGGRNWGTWLVLLVLFAGAITAVVSYATSVKLAIDQDRPAMALWCATAVAFVLINLALLRVGAGRMN